MRNLVDETFYRLYSVLFPVVSKSRGGTVCAGWKRIYEEKGFILEPGRPPTFSESNKKELKIMLEHNEYDTRISAFNEKAQELAIDRQVNTLKKSRKDVNLPVIQL